MNRFTNRKRLDGPNHQILLRDIFGVSGAGFELGRVGVTGNRHTDLHIVRHRLLLKLALCLENIQTVDNRYGLYILRTDKYFLIIPKSSGSQPRDWDPTEGGKILTGGHQMIWKAPFNVSKTKLLLIRPVWCLFT